jgi:hypothetical protein
MGQTDVRHSAIMPSEALDNSIAAGFVVVLVAINLGDTRQSYPP